MTMTCVVRLYLTLRNKKLDKIERELGVREEQDDILARTAEVEGISAGEAAALKARYRFQVRHQII